MPSNPKSDVDFERDVPTTNEDIAALERARDLKPLPTEAYLEWLSRMPKTVVRPWGLNTDEDEPFTL